MLDGTPFLFGAVSVLLQHLTPTLLEATDAGKLFKALQPHVMPALDIQEFLRDAIQAHAGLVDDLLQSRVAWRPLVEKEVQDLHRKHFKRELDLVAVPRAMAHTPSRSMPGIDVKLGSRTPPWPEKVKDHLASSPSTPQDLEEGITTTRSAFVTDARRRGRPEEKVETKLLLDAASAPLGYIKGMVSKARIRATPMKVGLLAVAVLSTLMLFLRLFAPVSLPSASTSIVHPVKQPPTTIRASPATVQPPYISAAQPPSATQRQPSKMMP